MFNSLQSVKNKFKGEILLALDSRSYWRKDYYPEYKAHRKAGKDESDINYDEFYPVVDSIVQIIRDAFPFKVLQIDKAEADDIAGVITREYSSSREIILVTSDHDWAQTFEYKNINKHKLQSTLCN